MNQPLPARRELARRLLTASRQSGDSQEHEAERVCGALRNSLTRFAGVDGSRSLLGRALALAVIEVPELHGIKMGLDGRLEGFDRLAEGASAAAIEGEAAVAITAQLLELLVTFIGEPLTLSLVRDAFPEMSLDE